MPVNLGAIDGIIPAYAGSTGEEPLVLSVSQDHPRVRGEHTSYSAFPFPFGGSSPRTRGALGAAEVALPVVGIIPAYAGSTGFADNVRR